MGSWRKLMVLGLLTGLVAAGCVITSGDDDDDDSGSAGSGTSDSGGSDSGGTGGSDTGGSGGSDTGGTGGSEEGCSLDGVSGSNACLDCIAANCCEEYDACTGDCADEFEDAQECIFQEYEEQGGAITGDDVAACVSGSAADGVLITEEMGDLMYCINSNEQCALDCTTVYEPGGEGGAGGAG